MRVWVIASLLFILSGFLLYLTDPYRKVKSGEYYLQCNGKEIPLSRIVGFIDDKNIWVFDNGYARNCKIIKKGEK